MKKTLKPLAGLIALLAAVSLFTGCSDNIVHRNVDVVLGITPEGAITYHTDVVVVGGGGAGFAAAVTAAREGHHVTMVEMLHFVGGNTLHAGGSMNSFHPRFQWHAGATASFTESDRQIVEDMITMNVITQERFQHLDLTPARRQEIQNILAIYQPRLQQAWDDWQNGGVFVCEIDGPITGGVGIFDSPYLHMLQSWDSGDFSGCHEKVRIMTFGARETVNWALSFSGVTSPSIAGTGVPGNLVGSLYRRNISMSFTVNATTTANPRDVRFFSGMGNAFVVPQAVYFLRLPTDRTNLLLEHEALEILVDEETGRAIGVAGRHPNGTFRVYADAVIITTGGFSGNPAMLEANNLNIRSRYFTGFEAPHPLATTFPPRFENKWDNISRFNTTNVSAGATGEGIMMAYRVGAALLHMDYIQLVPEVTTTGANAVLNPDWDGLNAHTGTAVPTAAQRVSATNPRGQFLASVTSGFSSTLIVNELGQRIVNETGRRDELALAWISQQNRGGRGIGIGGPNIGATTGFGAAATPIPSFGELYPILGTEADRAASLTASIADLAAHIHPGNAAAQAIFAANFAVTLENYNASFRDPENVVDAARKFLKSHEILPPFTTVNFTPPRIHHTMGGIQVNTDMQVIRQDGTVFPGLWAAGEVIGGLHGSNRVGGNAITDILVFGRIAGANASEFVTNN